MNDSKNAHRSIAGIFALTMIVLGCTVLGFEDTGTADTETDGQFPIDLDEDGTTDFVLERPRPRGHETASGQSVKIAPNGNNGIVTRQGEVGYVAALKEGDLIGQTLPDTLKWVSKGSNFYRVIYYNSYPDSSSVRWIGYWPARSDRYL